MGGCKMLTLGGGAQDAHLKYVNHERGIGVIDVK